MDDAELIKRSSNSLIKDLESMAFIIDNIEDREALQMLNGSLFNEAAAAIKRLVEENLKLKSELGNAKV